MPMSKDQEARARSAFVEACRIVGGKTALGQEIGVTPQAINGWGGIVPKKRAQQIADAVARHVARLKKAPTAKDLRPDL